MATKAVLQNRKVSQESSSKREGKEQQQRIKNPNGHQNKGARKSWSEPEIGDNCPADGLSFTPLWMEQITQQASSQVLGLVRLFHVQAGAQLMTEEFGCPAETRQTSNNL